MLLASVLFLTGCKSTLIVRDATVAEILQVFEDYVGTHGYQITYRNDETGSYRISLGNVYEPGISQTTQSRTVIVQPPPKNSNLPMTSYEDNTWRTVTSPGHYIEASAIVNITQADKDVLVTIDTNDAAGSSLNDITDYFGGAGYFVEKR